MSETSDDEVETVIWTPRKIDNESLAETIWIRNMMLKMKEVMKNIEL